MLAYCAVGGLTDDYRQSLTDAFKKFDVDHSETLEASELGPVVRWLGYQPSHYRIYSFAEDVGLRDDTQLGVREFRGIISIYKKMSLTIVRDLFCRTEDEERGKDVATGNLPMADIGKVMRHAGYELVPEEVDMMERELPKVI